MKEKKKQLRRQKRQQDYEKMMAKGSRESAVSLRMASGGYRRPGSNKR